MNFNHKSSPDIISGLLLCWNKKTHRLYLRVKMLFFILPDGT